MELSRKTTFDPIQKIWYGPREKRLYNPEASIGQMLYSRMTTMGNNVMQINDTEGTKFTFKEVVQMGTRIAISLIEKGVKQDEFVGIIAGNTSYVAPVVYGCYFAGIPHQPLDASFPADMIGHLWGKTKPKVVFCDGSVYNLVKETFEKMRLSCYIYTLNNHLDDAPKIDELLTDKGVKEKLFKPVEIESGDQTAYALCSSGSSGLPKVVCVSHKRIRFDSEVLTCEDVILSFSSLFWGTGLRDLHSSGMSGCTRIVMNHTFTPEKALELIEKYKVTGTFLAPRNIALLLNCPDIETRNLKSLNNVATGGSKLPVEIRTRFLKYIDSKCKFYIAYGTSEMGVVASAIIEGDIDSSGTLYPNFEVKIVDANENHLGIGEEGEIYIRYDCEWGGYYGDKAATWEVYQNGWYRTGDLGRFDEKGFIFIVDRISDVMKSKGYHVSPSEIESLIVKIPEVQEVSVCGIPDVMTINLPAALVVKKEGAEVSGESIQNFVAEKMPHFKHLSGGVYFVDSLPRTPTGKVIRKAVQEHAEKYYKSRS